MSELWESFPDDLLLGSVLVQGGAFRTPYEFGTEAAPGEKWRYFFVVSLNPVDCDEILLLTATTRIEKRRKVRDPRTLVELDPGTYPELDRVSVIDCNSLVPFPRDLLKRRIRERRFRPLDPLPDEVLRKVLAAISESKLVSPADRRLVLPEDFETDQPRRTVTDNGS